MASAPDASVMQQQVQIEIDAAQGLVIFKSRGRFDLEDKVTAVPFHMLDYVYMLRLQIGLTKSGVMQQMSGGGIVPANTPTPEPAPGNTVDDAVSRPRLHH